MTNPRNTSITNVTHVSQNTEISYIEYVQNVRSGCVTEHEQIQDERLWFTQQNKEKQQGKK